MKNTNNKILVLLVFGIICHVAKISFGRKISSESVKINQQQFRKFDFLN